MFVFLLIVEVILGLLLIGVILLQRSKEQGLGLAFGQGLGESLFGGQTVNVLVKTTVVLAVLFFLNTIVLARMVTPSRGVAIAPSADRESSPAPQGQGGAEMPAGAPQGQPAAGGAAGEFPAAPVPAGGAGTMFPAGGGAPAPAPEAAPVQPNP